VPHENFLQIITAASEQNRRNTSFLRDWEALQPDVATDGAAFANTLTLLSKVEQGAWR
jgi:hypothetical protein